ncbi:MAG TPA: phage baseplate assembly protein V [Aromatoleum sp.]|uniref:phage baseplate assembly protein V n=1 Tax=Aromatoleum sp. TaxID=2307007 RepID=UPI002B4815F2|nr:phage baseplate assembly protein V [Aromatoleum sp.]HJV27957.1 phage baseplate assembly protein V [Aromatoleum sp.]
MSGNRHSPGLLQELHLGVVLDNADPNNRGRVKLRLHATALETWASVMVPSAGSGYGVSLLPRIGEQVVVAFVAPDLPIVLGAVWSGGDSQPGDARPVDERYFMQSPAGIKVLLDDQEPKVKIETPAGNHLTITDQGGGKITIEEGGEKVEMSPGSIKITTAGEVKIEAAQVTVSAGMVKVDAGLSKFSGVVQCDTLISNAVVSASYTPGAGNIW